MAPRYRSSQDFYDECQAAYSDYGYDTDDSGSWSGGGELPADCQEATASLEVPLSTDTVNQPDVVTTGKPTFKDVTRREDSRTRTWRYQDLAADIRAETSTYQNYYSGQFKDHAFVFVCEYPQRPTEALQFKVMLISPTLINVCHMVMKRVHTVSWSSGGAVDVSLHSI